MKGGWGDKNCNHLPRENKYEKNITDNISGFIPESSSRY